MNEKIYKLINQTVNDTVPEAEPLTDEEVDVMMKRFKNENNRTAKPVSHKKRRIIAAVTAIAAAAVFVPTSVFAYSRISAKIEKTANYQNTVTIEAPTEPEALSENALPYMRYSLDYVPEGFVFGDAYSSHAGKYHNEETGGGISASFVRLPADGKEHKIDLRSSESCENYETEGKTAMINYRVGYSTYDGTGNPYGREVWIYFNDTRYVLQMFVTNDISREELYKIIDNISLYPTDEKRFGEYLWWEDPEHYDSGNENSFNSSDIINPDKINFLGIGDTASYDLTNAHVSFTINSAEFTESFEGIHTNSSGEEADFSAYMDENGNILPNTRTFYTVGDGIYTIDEDIMSYDMPYHILKMNVTVTNDADEYQTINIFPHLVCFSSMSTPEYDEEDLNYPSGYEDMKVKFRDSLDRINANINNKIVFSYPSESFFSLKSDDEHKDFKNYVSLAAGESTDIELCCVCSENMLGNIYLTFYGVGNSLGQHLKQGYPMYSLCDLRPE